MNIKLKIAVLLVFFGVISRFLPHAPNVAPVAAISLFSGIYFKNKYSLFVPMSIMFVSDMFLGFYSGMIWVYGSFLLIYMIGIFAKNQYKLKNIIYYSLFSSLLFFAITNFGVWISTQMYQHTLNGLLECYILAVPFFKNTLSGDLLFNFIICGFYTLLRNNNNFNRLMPRFALE